MLPQDFTNRMQRMLGEEYDDFLKSYELPKYQSLRINPLKTDSESFLAKAPFSMEKVPWAEYGYYYSLNDTPGKHPYHEAGVYYIQEPSAMAPVEYLGVKPGENILDLCAAPGGKSTQIASYMNGEGLLICNEINPGRAKILSENIERCGVRNAVVTNETPDHLAEYFENYFDRILVDAPCSGEGMFRKNEEACGEWSLENVRTCAKRQDEILDCASSMLKPGGRIVYSTCTFAPDENEGSIGRFLTRHPEFHTVGVQLFERMEPGVPEWMKDCPKHLAEQLRRTIRLWPHKLKGEGHYLAVLEKAGMVPKDGKGHCRNGIQDGILEKECKEYTDFCKETLQNTLTDQRIVKPGKSLLKFGEQLYLMPKDMPSIKGLKVLRPGLHLGTMKKNRFEPSHALALALKPEEVRHTIDLSSGGAEIRAYLNGQTLNAEGEKGWYLVTVDGCGIGWGKLSGGVLKNHYPKGLRIQY